MHTDLDIILVGDGSTDIRGAMCDAYVELDPRVRETNKTREIGAKDHG